jgi:hypothetical protein
MRIKLLAAAAILSCAFGPAANASPITYNFSGTVAARICTLCDGSDTSTPSGLFNLSIASDTSLVDNSGLPFSRLNNVSGAFSLGTFSGTLTGITIVATGDPVFHLINFFNASFDNGLGFNDPAFTGYDLTKSFGPITNATTADLTPTFNGGFFDVFGGGEVEFLRDTSLTYSAVGVPEPITLSLFGAGIAGLAAARRRKKS